MNTEKREISAHEMKVPNGTGGLLIIIIPSHSDWKNRIYKAAKNKTGIINLVNRFIDMIFKQG
jgi:hypothetical protein